MSSLVEAAKELLSKGYSVIPVNSNKLPAMDGWGIYQAKAMDISQAERFFKNASGIAMLMGGSKSLTGLDFDLKYSLTSDFYDRFKALIPVSILEKMFVQSTRNGGFHWVWSCPERIEGNQKLAQRLTTPEEKHEVYVQAFQDVNTRPNALKIASNHKVKVLVETRGEGGYILVTPTPGYTYVYGKINTLTAAEHDLILETARQFNEYFEPIKNLRMYDKSENGVNPFEEFKERGDTVKLLLENGWTITSENKYNIRFRRPGSEASPSSAMYDVASKVLNVFSTSTQFDVNRGYSPASVFIELEADGDPSLAYQKLCELGYNVKVE